jgi:hypothetical protein
MGYKVRYLVRERETGHERIATLDVAKTLVENAVASGAAESAEVVDSEGAIVFRRPRTVRRA